ncbi:hypothetical protein [Dactylosporangium salmoneum]|uniref:Uncharacterized protein n=1 Tax=Dactylosporangium salmoneum TaxID=53361 RepID=A0ABP5TBS5_9ACTN
MGLTVFVVLVVLAAGLEAVLPRRARPSHPAPEPEDLSFLLRSGLTPIRGYAEILAERVRPEDQRMVRAIEHHAERLTGLADRL